MRIVFAGTPEFADVSLKALLAAGHNVVAVFTQPDRPSGRGLKLKPSAVKQTAVAAGIPVYQPLSLRLDGKYPDDAQAAQAVLTALMPDVMVVAAYGLILPQWALDLPRAGCVNIHASLLPRWRGAAPIHRAIQAGDVQSGVCLMHMELGLDTGPVYAQETYPIAANMTGDELLAALSDLGATMLYKSLASIVAGQMLAVPQSADGVVYAHKLQRSDGVLNWALSSETLANQVRAFDSVLGSYWGQGDTVFKVWAAHALNEASAAKLLASAQPPQAGHVLGLSQHGIDIACGMGVLRVTEIQKPGGKRLPVHSCWQNLGLSVGQVLA